MAKKLLGRSRFSFAHGSIREKERERGREKERLVKKPAKNEIVVSCNHLNKLYIRFVDICNLILSTDGNGQFAPRQLKIPSKLGYGARGVGRVS